VINYDPVTFNWSGEEGMERRFHFFFFLQHPSRLVRSGTNRSKFKAYIHVSFLATLLRLHLNVLVYRGGRGHFRNVRQVVKSSVKKAEEAFSGSLSGPFGQPRTRRLSEVKLNDDQNQNRVNR
jgi:hypothetical protein